MTDAFSSSVDTSLPLGKRSLTTTGLMWWLYFPPNNIFTPLHASLSVNLILYIREAWKSDHLALAKSILSVMLFWTNLMSCLIKQMES